MSGEGVLFPHLYSLTSTAHTWQTFVERYKEAFSIDPLFSSGTAYESVMIACAAIGQADSVRGEDLRKTLLKNSPYVGLQEDIHFDSYGDCQRTYRVVTVRDGRFVEEQP